MLHSTDYTKYKATIVKQLKLALSLPEKGTVQPMLEVFYKYDPTNIIMQNYLQQLQKYVKSHIDINMGWEQPNISILE